MKQYVKGWAIAAKDGLYVGWYLTRKDAITDHTFILGKDWKQCKKDGDRAVKVKITYKEKP